MKIIDVKYFPITAGWYCDDKEAVEHGNVKSDHYLLTGNPVTNGFNAVREVGKGIGVAITLENQRVFYGDGTSVTYAGTAGRDRLFRYEDYVDYCKLVINDLVINQDTEDFIDIFKTNSDDVAEVGFKMHFLQKLPKIWFEMVTIIEIVGGKKNSCNSTR